MRALQQQNYFVDNGRDLSLFGGGLFLLIAARQESWKRVILGLLGAGLVYRGVIGRLRTAGPKISDATTVRKKLPGTLDVKETITVNTSAAEAYHFWRDLEQLPRFMTHLESVEMMEGDRSHWVARGPAGITLEWDAATVEDRPDELISWQTLPDSDVQHAGEVRFAAVPGGRGTEVTVSFKYYPPGGIAGEAFAHLTNTLTEHQIREEIRRFKQVLETGEVATIEGQPSARV